jgi:hypothetical protein
MLGARQSDTWHPRAPPALCSLNHISRQSSAYCIQPCVAQLLVIVLHSNTSLGSRTVSNELRTVRPGVRIPAGQQIFLLFKTSGPALGPPPLLSPPPPRVKRLTSSCTPVHAFMACTGITVALPSQQHVLSAVSLNVASFATNLCLQLFVNVFVRE